MVSNRGQGELIHLKLRLILTDFIKIIESVSMYVRMYGYMYVCPAMRFVMFRGIELKVSMRVGDGSTRFVSIFSKQSDQSVPHCWV